MTKPAEPRYHPIIVIDTAASGRWRDRTQLHVRMLLDEMVQTACHAAGINWRKIMVEDRGDGMILLLPATIPKARLLHPLISHLNSALRESNSRQDPKARIRLRMAVHAGEILRSPFGWIGTDLNLACHLANSRPLYRTLVQHPNLDLALVVSEAIYQAVVRHGHNDTNPDHYIPVHITAKEVRTRAWLHIPNPA